MQSTRDNETPFDGAKCRECGKEIKAMAFVGDDLCGYVCQKKWDQKNPPVVPLNVTLPEIDDILESAGVPAKYLQSVKQEWEALLAQKMPHLVRKVDTEGVESK